METALACLHVVLVVAAEEQKTAHYLTVSVCLAYLKYEPVYRYKIPVSYKNTGIIPV